SHPARGGGHIHPERGCGSCHDKAACAILVRAIEHMFAQTMNNTQIEWTDATWNPVTGCTEVSPGCDHCYARTFANRWIGVPGHPYEQGFDIKLWPNRLNIPFQWKKPRMVFVNSMSDLLHKDVPDVFIY